MRNFRALIRIFSGILFGIICAVSLSSVFAPFTDTTSPTLTALAMWIFVVIGALLGFFAPSIRRAFARGFLLAGISILAIPLFASLLTNNRVGLTQTGTDTATSGIVDAFSAAFSAVTGFILGIAFLATGLVLMRTPRREIVVIDRR